MSPGRVASEPSSLCTLVSAALVLKSLLPLRKIAAIWGRWTLGPEIRPGKEWFTL